MRRILRPVHGRKNSRSVGHLLLQTVGPEHAVIGMASGLWGHWDQGVRGPVPSICSCTPLWPPSLAAMAIP
eukprot:15475163-Alexandrium_andersonii.AAC.1